MLTEARDLAEELGDTEIRAEAMAWRVPRVRRALRPRRRRGARSPPLRETAERTAQPFMLHVAEHYGSAIALCDGRLERGRGAGAALARVEPAADRPRRLRRLRDPDVQHPPRAGPAGRARAGGPDPGRRGRARRAVAAGPRSRCSPSSGWRTRRGASSRGSPPTGSTRFRESLWLGVAHLPDRRLRGARRRGDRRRCVYPELEPLAGGNVMIGHLVACYGAADRYLGMLAATLGEWRARRGALRARAGAQPAHGRGDLARPHRLRVRRACCWRAARRPRPAPRRCSARRRRSPSGSACRRCSAASGALGAAAPAAGLPDGLVAARGADPRPRRARASATARSAATLSISEHTAANHIRSILRKTGCANRTEAASYAHRHGLVEA